MARGNEDNQMQLEMALEIKSLRRIISAYMNYPDASEQDVQRYERSFRRLPPSHKALLVHLPLKYQKLRWCITQNSYFIFEMLKAFEPPLDLSQDADIDENERLSNISDHWPSSGGINTGSCEHGSTNSNADRDGHNHCSMACSSSKVMSMEFISLTFFLLELVFSLLFIKLPSLSLSLHFHYEV